MTGIRGVYSQIKSAMTLFIHPHITSLAKEVAMSCNGLPPCNGLPLALSTIGRIMSMKKDPKEWRSIVYRLKMSGMTEIPELETEMFHRLKISYDHLEEIEQECFLVFALFGKDENIRKDRLISWWIGLGLLDVNGGINRGHFIMNTLLAQCLLQKGDNAYRTSEYSCVKIHPALQAMATWIVRESGRQWINLSTSSTLAQDCWLTLERAHISHELAPACSSPSQIRMLALIDHSSSQVHNQIQWKQFQNLSFLDFNGYGNMRELPRAVSILVKLQYLNLSGTGISFLPFELVRLPELRFLHSRQMKKLRQIPWTVSELKKLQVLNLFIDFTATTDLSTHSLSFMALPAQPYVSELLLELERSQMKLQNFGICVQRAEQLEILGRLSSVCITSICIDNLQQVPNNWNEDENEQEKFDLYQLSQIKSLTKMAITRCDSIKKVVAVGDPTHDHLGLFVNLEYLVLGHIEKVTWKNAGLNLRVVCLLECGIRNASWLQQLPLLAELKIISCHLMNRLVDSAESSVDVENQAAVTFPQLKKLKLRMLPQFCAISDVGCQFGKLSYLEVFDCKKLKALCLQPTTDQTNIRVCCSRKWWDKLAWSKMML